MVAYLLLLSVIIFGTGLALALTRKHIITILIGIELMLNASNLNFILFSSYDPEQQGQVFALLVMAVIICETAVALAIVFKIYGYYRHVQLDEL